MLPDEDAAAVILRWGIHFEEPYEMPEKAARPVFYADRFELEEEIMLRNGFWEDEEEEDVDEECEEDSFGKRGENPRYGQTERRMQWDIFKKYIRRRYRTGV